MKSFITNIKNLIPYFILISIYFLFINIEARNTNFRQQKMNRIRESDNDDKSFKSDIEDSDIRISIPVVPYEN
tara:strand:- start:143 stop:361 length:219 start_codon:yes stop_codon:yes gene_type:complete